MLKAIISINIIFWLVAAMTTGHEYEQFFPTIALFPGAVLAGLFLKTSPYMKCVGITCGCAVFANLLWIVYDISFIDKTSHNMAPFELIATGIFALLPGLCGVGIGRLLQRFFNR